VVTTTTSTIAVTTTLPVFCPAPGGILCNDDDPCTDDVCTTAIGCEHAEKVGLASLTCTCERTLPLVCVGEPLPRSVQRYATRACRLFNSAIDARPKKQARRLKQAVRALRRAESAVVRAQTKGVAPECAAALAAEYRGTAEHTAAILLGQPSPAPDR
jgi:hypothetical protein